MNCIEIDLETRSDRDITKCGVYAYADSPYFAITLMSISVDGGEVQQYDFTAGDTVPEDILRALVDETVIKRAHNVNFERICLSKYLRDNYPHIFRSYSIPEDTVGDYLSPRGWHCTMIHCRTLALPSTLADAGAALKLEQQKMPEGKALIKYFCIPYAVVIDGVPQFHAPSDAPEKWEIFKTYNRQDVVAELAIDERLSRYPVPAAVWEEFYLDQEINDRGIAVDTALADAALRIDAQAKGYAVGGNEPPDRSGESEFGISAPGLVGTAGIYTSDSLGKKEVAALHEDSGRAGQNGAGTAAAVIQVIGQEIHGNAGGSMLRRQSPWYVQLLWCITHRAAVLQDRAAPEPAAEPYPRLSGRTGYSQIRQL